MAWRGRCCAPGEGNGRAGIVRTTDRGSSRRPDHRSGESDDPVERRLDRRTADDGTRCTARRSYPPPLTRAIVAPDLKVGPTTRSRGYTAFDTRIKTHVGPTFRSGVRLLHFER